MIPLEAPVQHNRIPYDRGAWRRTVRYINNHERQIDQVRWAMREDPENLWTMMMLAGRAQTPAEGRALRRELIRIGLRHWAMELESNREAWNLAANPDFYPVMTAIIAHADDLWNEELDAQAEECFRFLRRLDPQDAFSIVRMMETRGIAMEDGAAPRTR